MGFIKRMKDKYDNNVQFAAILHKYFLLKEALTKKHIYPVDKGYWEECIRVYEANVLKGNKQASPSFLAVMKEEYNEYLSLLKEKEDALAQSKKSKE